MLQQMSSSPSAQVGEIARLHEGRWGDVSSEASSDAAEDSERPQCKIRRNYNCAKCTFYTQNPRSYLEHTRDAHFVKLKIFDCPYCAYASRHHQKLVRHIKMVHSIPTSAASTKAEPEQSPPVDSPATLTTEIIPKKERIEDMLEEVEDGEEMMMEVDDGPDDVEMVNERNAELATADPYKTKTKFFSCEKCNYVTHLRARYTKHVKYHSMPMIKCSICEFRTPYKWNLDRHMKHHGGTGSFNCSMCNFTADIKQSLTVHEMNHHTPGAGQSLPSRRRNRVGASDTLAAADDAAMRAALLPKEDEGSGDSRSSHSASDMGLPYAEKDIVSCKSDSNDGTDGLAKRDVAHLALDANSQHSPNSSTDESKSQRQSRKAPRPIPQLIPLNTSTPNQKQTVSGEPPHKKFKESTNVNIDTDTKLENLPCDITITPVNNPVVKENSVRKKNESFFDRLKERLLTETGEKGSLVCKNCGFESKCLSEHSVHEKNCMPQTNRIIGNTTLASLGSTRCQNCRHRCKSSADLYIHMQTCGNATNFENNLDLKRPASNEATTSNNDKEIEPHPMENVVFVWNNFQGPTKFDTPLDININNDSTLPEMPSGFDVDIIDDNESMNLSPSQAVGKKVFKCPHCAFFSRTASRFHVHIVGHLNKKPFECSLCKYKSNWRWDITKHIKLKSARDPDHNEAKVLMTDETGRRNYSKYNKFLATPIQNENGENQFHYIDPNSAADGSMEVDEPYNDMSDMMAVPTPFEMQPLNLQTQHSGDKSFDFIDNSNFDIKKPKKTLWKCKKCNYKDPSKEALLEHVRQHSRLDLDDPRALNAKKPDNTPDPADLAYRCGHCNQLSNWKHVIQRHCRLKHDGIVKVITTIKPKPDGLANDINNDTCNKCPFRSTDKSILHAHLEQHKPSPDSVFKCYFCPYFVKDEQDLIQHLLLHGITDPEEYINKASGAKSPIPDQLGNTSSTSNKRHRCTDCPYETNSKSQYMYHEQFHKLPADTPYKCPECNYSVSKRHLLHQHLRVHGITRKMDSEAELEASVSQPNKSDAKSDELSDLDEIPYVWVLAKDVFHKMFKCRYCSYVNSQKCKIPNHEKIHCVVYENEKTIYKCLECYYSFDCALKLVEHSKIHSEIYGRIYCLVDDDIPDEEQIAKLRKVIEADNAESMNNEGDGNMEGQISEPRQIKTVYFCQKCPARYFDEKEIQDHEKSHGLTLTLKCAICDFSVDDENVLNTHKSVHSDEYHTRSKMLKFAHNSHASYKQPRLEAVHQNDDSEVTWVLAGPSKLENLENLLRKPENKNAKQYCCKQCPAKFFKSSALCYHLGLHGGEGEHKCKKCNYAVKNIGNLAKHELLHENENKPSAEYESGDDMDYKNIPLSGTDLFQRKTEAQKRVLTDKDKLVKPNDHFPPVLQADPQFGYLMHGNPEFIYPTYMKNGRQKEKRYKCHKCPSAFEKREQYKIHLSLHGSKQRYKCEVCDYSVKYYANYVQHMRKHQMNDEAQAERRKGDDNNATEPEGQENVKLKETGDNIKLAIKTMPKVKAKSDFQQFSIGDQQTLRLLQRRRSMNSSAKDLNCTDNSPTKERKMHMCLLCPYTNQRQDSLTNHYRRHGDTEVLNASSHKCSFCDLVVVQSHFLREHLKSHFQYYKTLTAECYVANKDVCFTITTLNDAGTTDESEPVNVKIDVQHKTTKCNDEKTFVNTKSGELLVE